MMSLKKLRATWKHFTLNLSFQQACSVLYSSPFQKEVCLGVTGILECIVATIRAWLLRRYVFSWALHRTKDSKCAAFLVLPKTAVSGAQFIFTVSPEVVEVSFMCLLSSQVLRFLHTHSRCCLSPAWATGTSAWLCQWHPLVFMLEVPWHI